MTNIEYRVILYYYILYRFRGSVVRKNNIRAQFLLTVLIILVAVFIIRDAKVSPFKTKARRDHFRDKALILYDEHAKYDGGSIYATVLSNLLGHFKVACVIKPASAYRQGDMDDCVIVFYIGFIKNAYIPDALFKDIFRTGITTVWFQHNLNQLQGSFGPGFLKEYGFGYARTVSHGENTKKNPPDFFDRFYYKDKVLDRSEITGRSRDIADISMVIVEEGDPSVAKIRSTVENPDTGEKTPYIIQSGNIWFVADIPFSFLNLRDEYLIVSDMLHEMLKADHPGRLSALVRIEDVSANTSPDEVKALADFFKGEKVPFSIGVIPFFRDPAAVTGDRAIEKSLSDSPEMLAVLKGAQARGASIIMHGTTHQRDYFGDPSLRVTSVGYEFWDSEKAAPVKDDSIAAVKARIELGKSEFLKCGLNVVAFEAPHYTASASDYRVFAKEFDFTMQNVTYFLYDASGIPAHRAKVKGPVTEMVNQAFPYVIYRDAYGQFVIPGATVDNFEYEEARDAGLVEAKLDRIVKQADAMTVVRDGCASFYIHPYLITGMKQHNIDGLAVLKKMIDAFRNMGYEFTDIQELEKGS